MYQQFLNHGSAQLSYMSSDELREIFGDDDKLDERIDQILKPLENEKDVIITENRTLAESNLQKEPNLIELRSKINDLSEEFRNLSENVQTKLIQLKSKSNTSDPESVLARLQACSAESEEKSDEIADEFFDSKLTIDEFLDQFKVTRTQMHLRKLKAEKMQELLRRGSHHNPPNSNFPPPNTGFYGAAPYPTSMPAFPMPVMRPSY
ncbi:vacuolar protein sorting-associated protein 37B [Chironomus tepperi]|uniref:vacuolar protein sorting-associated protein 37B n=1 Tax=Chironomus tepperi TaxID=113505 RepID=UPI00391F3650